MVWRLGFLYLRVFTYFFWGWEGCISMLPCFCFSEHVWSRTLPFIDLGDLSKAQESLLFGRALWSLRAVWWGLYRILSSSLESRYRSLAWRVLLTLWLRLWLHHLRTHCCLLCRKTVNHPMSQKVKTLNLLQQLDWALASSLLLPFALTPDCRFDLIQTPISKFQLT